MAYVMVAVPAELLPKIAELVAEVTGDQVVSEESPVAAPNGTMPTADKPSADENTDLVNGWTAGLVRRAYDESGDGMRRILDHLAENAGKEITTYEIADNVPEMNDWNSVAGALGAFGRRCANRYGMKLQPWTWRYDSQDRVLMKMPAAVAEVIKKAAAE